MTASREVRRHGRLTGTIWPRTNASFPRGRVSDYAVLLHPEITGVNECSCRNSSDASWSTRASTRQPWRFRRYAGIASDDRREMPKPDSINAGPASGRATAKPVSGEAALPRGWNWIDGAPRPLLIAFSALALGVVVLWGIEKATAGIDFRLLVATLRATPAASLAAALAATALSYLGLIGYDVSALRYARAHAPLKTALLASFCGFAIGNSVGLGAFSGGAVRYRLYTAAGLSPGQIARVILFISVAFGVGLTAITALS